MICCVVRNAAVTRDRRGRKASQPSPARGRTNKPSTYHLASGGSGRPAGRPDPKSKEPVGDKILIELSKAQVDQIIRTAGESGAMSVLLSALESPEWGLSTGSAKSACPSAVMDDDRLSRSLLLGLRVLSCFSDGEYKGVAEIAKTLGMSPSTTHRYISTLLAVGLLEQDASTRQYRLAR